MKNLDDFEEYVEKLSEELYELEMDSKRRFRYKVILQYVDDENIPLEEKTFESERDII